ncbi:MAG: TlyA family RNA methyltransferase [Promethearchaeota archaeon]
MKERLDILLVGRRMVESRTKAQWLIRNLKVLVNGKILQKPGKLIDNNSNIELIEQFPYVGKGGIKLEAALEQFSISVKGKICADLGASVGGFTDCLIKHGAKRVYAIDTATDLLHPSLVCEKMEGKVIPMLGTDVRTLTTLEEMVDICTIDITFASLTVILPTVKNFLKVNGDIIALVKPLFETEYHHEKRFNIVEDFETLYHILFEIYLSLVEQGIYPYGLIKSPLKGKGGSTEFFYHFRIDKKSDVFEFRDRINDIFERKGNLSGFKKD